MREAKINLARVLIEELGPTYRKNKRELSSAEKILYENALKISVRAMLPREEVKPALEEYEQELERQQKAAEEARAARLRTKTAKAEGDANAGQNGHQSQLGSGETNQDRSGSAA